MRSLVLIGALLLAACSAGSGSGYFRMPGPNAGGYTLTIWNKGLGLLHVTMMDEYGQTEGGRHTVDVSSHRVLTLFGEGRHLVQYESEGKTYRTVITFQPSPDEPCWGMVVSTSPQLDVVNPLPMDCRR